MTIKVVPQLSVSEAAALARRERHKIRVYLGRTPDNFADLYSYAGSVIAKFGDQRREA